MRKTNERFTRFGRVLSVALILGLVTILQALPALAHGGAELTVTPTIVVSGGTVQVKAIGVETGEEFTIRLDGIQGQVALGTVTVGDEELFLADYTIPADTPSGVYQLTAVSGEGESVTVELTVEADATVAVTDPARQPSAKLMQLDRSKSVGEWVVIAVGLLVSAGLGLALVVVKK